MMYGRVCVCWCLFAGRSSTDGGYAATAAATAAAATQSATGVHAYASMSGPDDDDGLSRVSAASSSTASTLTSHSGSGVGMSDDDETSAFSAIADQKTAAKVEVEDVSGSGSQRLASLQLAASVASAAVTTMMASSRPGFVGAAIPHVMVKFVDPCTYQKSPESWPAATLTLQNSRKFLSLAMGSDFASVSSGRVCYRKNSETCDIKRLIPDVPNTVVVLVMTYCTSQLLRDIKDHLFRCAAKPDESSFLLVCSKWDKLDRAFVAVQAAVVSILQGGSHLSKAFADANGDYIAFRVKPGPFDLEALTIDASSNALLGDATSTENRVGTWA
jgi:hypothetical protein